MKNLLRKILSQSSNLGPRNNYVLSKQILMLNNIYTHIFENTFSSFINCTLIRFVETQSQIETEILIQIKLIVNLLHFYSKFSSKNKCINSISLLRVQRRMIRV